MKPRILLAEDDPVVTRIVTASVAACGLTCEAVADGVECLERLRKGTQPDLLLLDLVMPRMGGLEVLESLARAPFKDRFPIAVLSGRNETEAVRKAIALGADDFIVKPCAIAELVRRIGDLVFVADEARMRPLIASLKVPDPSLAPLAVQAGFEAQGISVAVFRKGTAGWRKVWPRFTLGQGSEESGRAS